MKGIFHNYYFYSFPFSPSQREREREREREVIRFLDCQNFNFIMSILNAIVIKCSRGGSHLIIRETTTFKNLSGQAR